MTLSRESFELHLIGLDHCYGGKARGILDLLNAGMPIPTTYSVSSRYLENQELLAETIIGVLKFPLIIRSSTNVEDSIRSSFAGLFESYVCYNLQDVLIALREMRCFVQENIQLAYPGFDCSSVCMNVILQPYLMAEMSGVFISSPDTKNQGYGEYVYGQPNRILHDGEMDGSFFLSEQGIRFEDEKDNTYRYDQLIYKYLLMAQNYFFDCPYQYEWCISDGIFYFLQKRPISYDTGTENIY